jgi:L-ascorbate metabolism protein UlaG (beta-lactamase superfamily)
MAKSPDDVGGAQRSYAGLNRVECDRGGGHVVFCKHTRFTLDVCLAIAPLGNDAVIARSWPGIVIESQDWREEVEIGGGATVWLHPGHHWSARGIADRRMALWCGYAIAMPAGAVYVPGDTGYGDGRIFAEVADRYPVVGVAVLPIGAYAPRWFIKDQHVNPAEAVRIMQDCGRGKRSAFTGAPFH